MTAPPAIDSTTLADQIKRCARDLGFDLIGIAPASPSQYRDYFTQWLATGQAGTMQYLHDRFDERTDPSVYLPGAKSVISLAMNYHVPLEPAPAQPSPTPGRIARYALGDDYHEVMKPKLHALADFIRALAPEARTKCAVDTAPVMEKELAARAGIGWFGKNSCIINPHLGSWLFLGEVITTLALPFDAPATDHCGTCTRCIDACPTGAITEPYRLDARRCISYLTIEHRADDTDPTLRRQISPWLYGCDICQDVCPFNGRAPASTVPAFTPRFAAGVLDAQGVLNWRPEDYQNNLRRSAMKRVKLPVLQRNARILTES